MEINVILYSTPCDEIWPANPQNMMDMWFSLSFMRCICEGSRGVCLQAGPGKEKAEVNTPGVEFYNKHN